MTVLSILKRSIPICQSLGKSSLTNGLSIQLRNHGDKQMIITPSRWSWHKFKDLFHFYFMLGALPLTAMVLYVNIFIGPAQLAPIPEGYYPEKWEYYKHPICRWFAKYIYDSHQEEYERLMQVMYEEHEKKEMRTVQKKIKFMMHDRGDSKYSFYRAPVLDYLKQVREEFEFEREYNSGPED